MGVRCPVFELGGDEDGNVRVGVFPDCEEILISGTGFGGATIGATLALNKGAAKQALEVLQTALVRCSQALATRSHLISRCCCADSRLGLPNRISTPTMGP